VKTLKYIIYYFLYRNNIKTYTVIVNAGKTTITEI